MFICNIQGIYGYVMFIAMILSNEARIVTTSPGLTHSGSTPLNVQIQIQIQITLFFIEF